MKSKRTQTEKYPWDSVELEEPLSKTVPTSRTDQRLIMGRRLERLRHVLDLSQEEICSNLQGAKGRVLTPKVWQRMARGGGSMPAEMLQDLIVLANARGLIHKVWVAWVVYALIDPEVSDDCWEAGLRFCSTSILDLMRPETMEPQAWKRAVNWRPFPGVTKKLRLEIRELAQLRAPNHRQPQAAKAIAYYNELFSGKRLVEVELGTPLGP